jgi:hypothetical protein
VSDTRAFWFQCDGCGATTALPVQMLDPPSWRVADDDGTRVLDIPPCCAGHHMQATHTSGSEHDDTHRAPSKP